MHDETLLMARFCLILIGISKRSS